MINQVTIVGRLSQDPVIKEVNGGKNVCEVKVALQRPFKNAQNKYETDFVRVVFWEYLAINVNEYFKKGYIIGIKGRLQVRSTKINDVFAEALEVIGEHIVFIGKPSKKPDTKIDVNEESIPVEELQDVPL